MLIEKLRDEMEQLAIEKGLNAPEVLQKSMELDKLLNKALLRPRNKFKSA